MKAILVDVKPNKTYATRENVMVAVSKLEEKLQAMETRVRYFIMTTDEGRFFPVFIGDKAILAGIHFHFNVVG